LTLLSDVTDDVTQLLLVKSASSDTWRHLVSAKMTQKRDSVAFQLTQPAKRLLTHLCCRLNIHSFSGLTLPICRHLAIKNPDAPLQKLRFLIIRPNLM